MKGGPCYAPTVDAVGVSHFRTFGYVLLRGVLDPRALGDELRESLRVGTRAPVDTSVARVQYVPMQSERTPESLRLLLRLEPLAQALLGGPVLPLRAKGMRYHGSTRWHADSTSTVASVGFAAYLEPLDSDSGALRVLPGTQHPALGAAVARHLAALGSCSDDACIEALPGVSLRTEPGDVIAFDEHLFHASRGGGRRHQWRVDYLRAPTAPAEEQAVRDYLAGIFPVGWDGGYDPDAFPSFGAAWLASGHPAVEALRTLGALDLAAGHEAFLRARWIAAS